MRFLRCYWSYDLIGMKKNDQKQFPMVNSLVRIRKKIHISKNRTKNILTHVLPSNYHQTTLAKPYITVKDFMKLYEMRINQNIQ